MNDMINKFSTPMTAAEFWYWIDVAEKTLGKEDKISLYNYLMGIVNNSTPYIELKPTKRLLRAKLLGDIESINEDMNSYRKTWRKPKQKISWIDKIKGLF